MKRVTFFAVVAAFLTATQAVRASDPTGLYARIDKVVFEPNDQNPERIQVWGSFALAKAGSRDDYQNPAEGFMYFSVSGDKPELCRKEWADLKKVAGTPQCVAFGSRYKPLGKVRKMEEKPKDPDSYPIAGGMYKVEATHPQAKLLKATTNS
jgi:hypothetical protein